MQREQDRVAQRKTGQTNRPELQPLSPRGQGGEGDDGFDARLGQQIVANPDPVEQARRLGSLGHLDPSAELPTVAQGLDATIHIQSKRGARTLAMADFPSFFMTPAIEPDEIVSAIEFEPWSKGHGFAFVEFVRRHGDFAIVGVATLLELSADGMVSRASITLGGVGQAPIRCGAAEGIVIGSNCSDAAISEAADSCREIDAMDDVHVTAAYRRHLAVALTRRALKKAYDRASGETAA